MATPALNIPQKQPMVQPPMAAPSRPLIRVVPPAQHEENLRAEALSKQPTQDQALDDLAKFIREQYDIFRNHRDDAAAGWSSRLMQSLRAFNGEYDPSKLSQIKKFGGSEVYARLIAMKCRGASSLLRDVYLGSEKPWGIGPPEDPNVPDSIKQKILELVSIEVQTLQQMGQQVDESMVRDRGMQLMEAARQAEKKQSEKRAKQAQDKVEEILVDGGFYKALAAFLVDVPLFPFAAMKGPVVKIQPKVSWANGQPNVTQTPVLTWKRISPFDLYWTPGASDIEDAATIERDRLTRADLNDLLDLPGYNTDNIRRVLDEYGSGGIADDWDSSDAERAAQENRENPRTNRSGMLNCLEYNGNVQGKMLIEYGLDTGGVEIDPIRDYMVQAWLIGRYVIKVQLTPSPRKRHPYYITSFEKVPGTPVGNGLPDILSDIQEVANATLRSLVNNLSISSGPQVVINDERLSSFEDGEDLFPWKRWHTTSDPMGNNSQVPISFFQPVSNAQELLAVYQSFNQIADDLSAIPKYLSGQSPGGAGRTAAGLAMLMGNASKILQTVAANIDRDVIEPLLQNLFDMLMLTDTSGVLQGDENVRVLGVNVAVQRETQRARQLEFLQITANPIDAPILGIHGRGAILRSVAETIGLPGEKIVPSEEELMQMQQMAMQMAAQQPPPGEKDAKGQQGPGGKAQGNQTPKGGNVTKDQGPRTNIAGGAG